MNWDLMDRFNAAYPNMTPPRGLSLVNSPFQGPIPTPMARPPGAAPLATDVYNSPGGPATDPSAPPFRLDPSGVPPFRPVTGVAPPTPAALAPFPTDGASAPAVPYTKPNVDVGPQGVTMTSTPPAPGWAGTVGLPATAEEAIKQDINKRNINDVFAGLGEVAKGIQNKPSEAAQAAAAQLTPMSVAPNTGSQLAGELMSQILRGKQARGLTLTGRMA